MHGFFLGSLASTLQKHDSLIKKAFLRCEKGHLHFCFSHSK